MGGGQIPPDPPPIAAACLVGPVNYKWDQLTSNCTTCLFLKSTPERCHTTLLYSAGLKVALLTQGQLAPSRKKLGANQGFQSGPVPGTFTRLRSCIVPAEITEPPQN